MQIEAVTVCHNYDDFLQETIPYNLSMFDRWLIVTHPDDRRTRTLCRRFGLECITTEEGHAGGEFAKGRMIERGLQHLRAEGWRVHLDADIALPRHFRTLLELADLQADCVHGCDRVMVHGLREWKRLQESGWLDGGHFQHSCGIRFPPGFEVGTRWVGLQAGYVPIGFFQMWHSSADQLDGVRTKPYPRRHNTACRTDVQHSLQWDRKRRVLLPELIVAHLESEPAPLGANWNGRRTRRLHDAACQGGGSVS